MSNVTGSIQSIPSSWYLPPIEEQVEIQSAVLLSEIGLDKNIKTPETTVFLDKVDIWMQIICTRNMDHSEVSHCIEELHKDIRELRTRLRDARERAYDIVPDNRLGGYEIAQLKEGCDAADRNSYLEKLISYNQISQIIGDEIKNIPSQYKKSIKEIIYLHHSGSIFGDLKALNNDCEVPDLDYNLGQDQFG